MLRQILSPLLIALVFFGCAQKPEERQVQKKDKDLSIQLEATAFPHITQTITSVTGKIKTINKNVGDFVKPGDEIFAIDEKVIKRQIKELEYEISMMEKNLRGYKRAVNSTSNPSIIHLARLNLEKVAKLYSQGFTSEERYDNAKTRYANALFAETDRQNTSKRDYTTEEQNLIEKRTELFVLKEQLNETTVKANIQGFISELDLYNGQQVANGDKVGEIIDLSRIKLKAGLATGLLPFIKEGTEVDVTFLTTPAYILKVPVKRVVPIVDPEFGRMIVEFDVPNRNYIVQAGTKALVSIPLNEEDQAQVNKVFLNGDQDQKVLSIKGDN